MRFTPVSTPADVLRDSKGIMRQSELLDETDYPDARADLDRLVIDGKVERFPVGDYIMLRWTGD